MKRSHLEIRDDFYNALIRNFIGPLFGEEETLGERNPHDTYLTGAIYPAAARKGSSASSGGNKEFDPGDYEAMDKEGRENSADEARASAKDVGEEKVLFPSSAGISFRVDKRAEKARVLVSFGTYTQIEIDGKKVFQRKHNPFDFEIDLKKSSSKALLENWAYFDIRCREVADSRVITVTLLNKGKKEDFIKEGRNNWLFRNIGTLWQVSISVQEILKGDFKPITPETKVTNSGEVNANFLLYRNLLPYSAGHNCSADWDEVDGHRRVSSAFIPRYLLRMMVPSALDGVDLSIENFVTTDKLLSKGILSAENLLSQFDAWIQKLEKEMSSFSSDEKKIGTDLLSKIKQARTRIESGIRLIKTDTKVSQCAAIANEVMAEQSKGSGKPFSWHPFQFAFFLLNLEGIVNDRSPDRKIADLLWFPTGGGKTEAYLLISAFTIAWRRSIRKEAGGTAILLRYTLRLLTQQQLQRAAKMICAMEKLRRRKYPDLLGPKRISIGLWVGNDSFPNTVRGWMKKRDDGTVPVPFEACPSCKTPMNLQNYRAESRRAGRVKFETLEIQCKNSSCDFHKEALPIHLTDEDAYRYSPTMIVGTVDKFANLAWKADSGKLLNRYDFSCNDHGAYYREEERCACAKEVKDPPPDLIIQDELHLISGPLGSMVGAFENAIRFICRQGDVEPKYITSTATIRGAERQLFDLYGRSSFQFPPSGFDANYNFFAEAEPASKKMKTRAYVGLSPQGRSPKLVMARLCGLLNHRYHEMMTDPDVDKAALDFFRTAVGYFNARKELGGVKTMLGDDVPKWRKFHHGLDESTYNPDLPADDRELMGSVGSRELMQTLEDMGKGNHTAPEFVLATNILSVGIDIDRLSLMMVAGQPKTASEYIQASSRVGRKGPGLVVVSFNWARARDRSHFEKFRSFHEQLYRNVEGNSVTPYSPEARRRTLAGLLVAVARHTVPELRGDSDAINFDRHARALDPFVAAYLSEISDIDERGDAKNEIEKILSEWELWARNKAEDLPYKAGETKRGVLGVLGESADNCVGSFVTSLRNVDEEVPAIMARRNYATV